MEISCWIQGFNEEKNLPKLFAPLKDIKDIVFIDHESTDGTAKLAKSLGARVFTLKFPHDKATKNDVLDFTQRFRYPPRFKAKQWMQRSWEARTEGQKYCKNDWVLNLDCDEVLTWDMEKVKKVLPYFDAVNCKYYHERMPDGGRKDWFQSLRLYNRKKTFWIGRIHEVINGYDIKVGWTNDMEIDHFTSLRDKSNNINVLEYAVLRDQDSRSFFYLGKEYHHYHEWAKAIKILQLYLKEAWYMIEKVRAYEMIAESLWYLGRDDEAWVYAFQALKLNPMSKSTYLLLAEMASKSEKEMWMKHAELAVNNHFI